MCNDPLKKYDQEWFESSKVLHSMLHERSKLPQKTFYYQAIHFAILDRTAVNGKCGWEGTYAVNSA